MRRDGLTLMELLAALAIAAALAGACLHVMVTLTRAGESVRTRQEGAVGGEAVRAILALDLSHAGSFLQRERGGCLWTQVSLSPEDMRLRHLQGKVCYRIRRIGDRNWLIRSQQSEPGEVHSELLCDGVKAVRFEEDGRAVPPTGKWRPLTDVHAMVVQWDDPKRGELVVSAERR